MVWFHLILVSVIYHSISTSSSLTLRSGRLRFWLFDLYFWSAYFQVYKISMFSVGLVSGRPGVSILVKTSVFFQVRFFFENFSKWKVRVYRTHDIPKMSKLTYHRQGTARRRRWHSLDCCLSYERDSVSSNWKIKIYFEWTQNKELY